MALSAVPAVFHQLSSLRVSQDAENSYLTRYTLLNLWDETTGKALPLDTEKPEDTQKSSPQ